MRALITLLFLLYINLVFSQSIEIEKKQIKSQIILAGEYYRNSDYEKALEISKLVLVRSFKIDDDYLISRSYNMIGVIYNEFSDSKRAVEFYKKALKYANHTENDTLKDWIYGNLGSVFYYDNIDIDKGIKFYKIALQYADKVGVTEQMNYDKLNLASAYFTKKDFKTGIRYINEIEKFIKTKGDEESKLQMYALLGIYFSHKNKPDLAENYFNKAISIGISNNFDSYLIDLYDNLWRFYLKHNKIKEAKLFKVKYTSLSQKIYSPEKKVNLKNSSIQIELDEYRNQLEKIELKNEMELEKIKNSRTINLLLSFLIPFLLVLIFFLYKHNKTNKTLNAALLISNKKLQIAKEVAEENSRLKSQFVSTISHELRTPLYGVIGITDILIEEYPDLKNNLHVDSLKFSAKYLLALVNDVLQISKMDENKIVLNKTVFNLNESITTIKNALSFMADNNGNVLKFDFDPKIPSLLIGDELRLSQIFMNLLSNALKFTKNGEVTLSAHVAKMEGEYYYLKFQVKDTGIGIAKEDQSKIFEKFVQIERKGSDYEGTGLGLTIVKKLISLFESEIHIESKENQGTTFYFTIRFKIAKQQISNIETPIQVEESTLLNLKILVVEDNKINQIVTKKIIESKNHNCIMVNNGLEAIDLVKNETFDLILMDINMPILNGYETSKRIRNLKINTPIIALTALNKNEVVDKLKDSGIDDIIIKPFNQDQLFDTINLVLSKS
jgi:signal transduction histidine kinase/CheY-like chemotaxis protein/Tfp pilus assembly protein PilF